MTLVESLMAQLEAANRAGDKALVSEIAQRLSDLAGARETR